MKEREDGGPAFPAKADVDPRGMGQSFVVSARGGMSLRDWFAGQALMSGAGPDARYSAERADSHGDSKWHDLVASSAYAFADAMLAARKKAQP